MDTSDEFWKTYEQLSQRLKRKYLRKKDFFDSLDHFSKLAKHLDEESCPQYAAFCSLAVAKCEQSMGQSVNEARAYSEAAEYFMKAHLQSRELNYEEHLSAALQAYSAATKIYCEQDQVAMAGALLLRVGAKLVQSKKYQEAVIFYQRGNEMNQSFPCAFMKGMEGVALSLLLSEDYLEANNSLLAYMQYLQVRTDVTMEPFRSALGRCKQQLVLLSLVVRDAITTMSEPQQKLCDTFDALHFSNPVPEISPEVFFAIQSIILAVRFKDINAFHIAMNSVFASWNEIERLILKAISSSILK